MAETPSKRQREEEEEEDTHNFGEENEAPKRQKPYTQILSLLEQEEEEEEEKDHEELEQDFSSILATLQMELDNPFYLPGPGSDPDGDNQARIGSEENDEAAERFVRHLFEASDDELGIPHRIDGGDDEEGVNGGDEFSLCGDGLWEWEDDVANYYGFLQSELFM